MTNQLDKQLKSMNTANVMAEEQGVIVASLWADCLEECLQYLNYGITHLTTVYDLNDEDDYLELVMSINGRIMMIMDEFNSQFIVDERGSGGYYDAQYCMLIAKLPYNREFTTIGQLSELIIRNEKITDDMFLGVFRNLITNDTDMLEFTTIYNHRNYTINECITKARFINAKHVIQEECSESKFNCIANDRYLCKYLAKFMYEDTTRSGLQ